MPLVFPPSPSIDQIEPYNGKNWRWNGAYWSAVSQYPVFGPNTFQSPVMQDYYETLIAAAPSPVGSVTGTLLAYL